MKLNYNTIPTLLAFIVSIAIATLWNSDKKKYHTSLTALTMKVLELEKKIDTIEQDKTLNYRVIPSSNIRHKSFTPGSDWTPFIHDDVTYYYVPLSEQ